MFLRKGKKRCGCGNDVSPEWSFCPSCGRSLKEREIGTQLFGGLDGIFAHMDRQMQEMDKLFAQPMKMPRMVLRPGGSGISISITSGTGQKPNVSVRTFGGAKKLEPEIRQKIGVGQTEERSRLARPAVTEEPEMEIRKDGSRLTYCIKLPDVSAKDVQIKRLPNSIEIRAISGKKLYFKLFEAPSQLSILDKKFSDGTLTLVLG